MIERADLYEAWVIACKQHYEKSFKKGAVEGFPEMAQDKLPEEAQKSFKKKIDASAAFAEKAGESFTSTISARTMVVHGETAVFITMDVGGGLQDVELFDMEGKIMAHATIEANRIHWKKIGYGAT